MVTNLRYVDDRTMLVEIWDDLTELIEIGWRTSEKAACI